MRRRNNLALLALFSIFTISVFIHGAEARENNRIPRITLVGNSIYINGEKFLIKGVGYSPYRPGQSPGARIPLDIVKADFKRIKEAGFNTLRVWDIMPEEQLDLAEKYGLKVIQAVSLMPGADFGYSGFIRLAESKVRQMCRKSRNHPNVIMYLLMNEPHADAILNSGIDKTIDLYARLIDIVKKEDPNRPVSMANAYWTLWLDQSLWDVLCFNTYSYTKLAADIGYENFVRNLKGLHSKDKPFVVTEFGLSVSPKGPGGGGYGGNNQIEQAKGLTTYFRQLITGGAAGGCVFEWNDEWWKAGNPAIHDGQAEEWFGIIGIENKSRPLGEPRKAYYSLREELKLVVTKPTEGYRMLENTEIEANVPKTITNVQYRIDNGQWMPMSGAGDWRRGMIDASLIEPGLHILTVKGNEAGKQIIRRISIIKCKDKDDLLSPINVEISTDKTLYKNGETIKVRARLADRNGIPLSNRHIRLGMLNASNNYSRCWAGLSDSKGLFSKTVPVIGRPEEWYYIFWAATEGEDYTYTTEESYIRYIKAVAGEGYPIKWLTAGRAPGIMVDGIIEDAWLEADKIEISADTNFAEGDLINPEDLSAEVRVMWDSANIYILAVVKDDVPMKNNYNRADIWKGDCVELFIGVDPAKIPEIGYSESDFQILIGTNGKMWIPSQNKGGVRNNAPKMSRAVAKKTSEGYILEAKINIGNFWDKGLKKFNKGDKLGFDIAVGDADESGIRDAKLVWNGTADNYKDSAIWGRVRLK